MNGELLGITTRSSPRVPMETPGDALVTTQAGLQGDLPDQQMTIVSADSWRDASRNLELKSLGPTDENLLLGGIDLRDTDGGLITIGYVH